MIVNQTPYPISFGSKMSQAIVCRYSEEGREYVFLPDIQDFTDCSALLQIVKPDNTFTENGVEIRTDEETGETTLVIEIPQQATAAKGYGKYSICIYKEDMVIYSAEGPIWIDDSLITDEMIESIAEVNGYRFPQDFLTEADLTTIIPEILPEDKGKFLHVNTITGDKEWSNVPVPYPDYNASDAGKSLTVNAAGTGVEWKSTEHVYSTSEQVIGKWIDGSTVYERTFDRHTNPVTMSAYSWHYFVEIDEPIKIIDSMGIVVDNGDISANYPLIAVYYNGYLQIMHLRNGAVDTMGYVTIRYIK